MKLASAQLMRLLAPRLPHLPYIQLVLSSAEAPQAPTLHTARLLQLDISRQTPVTRAVHSRELWITPRTCPITDHRRPPLAIAQQIPLALAPVFSTGRRTTKWEATPDSIVPLTSLCETLRAWRQTHRPSRKYCCLASAISIHRTQERHGVCPLLPVTAQQTQGYPAMSMSSVDIQRKMRQDRHRQRQPLRPIRKALGPRTVCRMVRIIVRHSSREMLAIVIGQILTVVEGNEPGNECFRGRGSSGG